MAPEQRRGDEVGPAADIYALGLVLCEMVTGSVPARDALPVLEPRWDAVIRRCLEPDPRLRFARAEDVAAALAGRAPVAVALADARYASLPSERDPFVGREAELADLESARAEGARVVTLVGPGGMGKTRLAIRFGWRTAHAWPGGIWHCDLTEARSADGIASAVGVALGVQLGRGDAILQLGHAIADRGACLLVLDNFEQVVAHAADTLGRWRGQAQGAVFLVTSRERLGIEGERVRAVEPLSADEALELFTLRVRGLRPGFEFAGEDATAAREIVGLLDGIPLAIELAAARIRVMSVGQIVEGLRNRFRLLAGGSGARHETLERAIDGSWDLLAPWERAACAQCAVFEGGCTLEAAIAVLELGAWPEAPPIVDVLRSLVDKSLVRSWAPFSAPGEEVPDTRFGMYVSLQEYARARLHESGAAERAAEERHGAHYAGYGRAEVIEAIDRVGGAPKRRRLGRELDNIVISCRRAIARGDGATVAATYHAAYRVLKSRGPLGVAIALGREALADARLEGAHRASVSGDLCEMCWHAGKFDDALAHGEAAQALALASGDAHLIAQVGPPLGRAYFVFGRGDEALAALAISLAAARAADERASLVASLNALGMVHHEQGRIEEARAAYDEALAIVRAIGDRGLEAVTVLSQGILEHKRGRLDEAGACFAAALAIHRELGNRRSEGLAHVNLGSLLGDQGRLTEAREHAEAALSIARSTGSRSGEGNALAVLGEIGIECGEIDEARAHFEAALAIHRELGFRGVEGIILANLAHLDDLDGRPEQALSGYEAALAIHREIGDRHYEGSSLTSLAGLLLDRELRDEARDAVTTAESILRELGARSELARVLCVRAELEHATGDREAALAALREGESLVAELAPRAESELGRGLARARQALAAPVGGP
jgi:predicted ATPase